MNSWLLLTAPLVWLIGVWAWFALQNPYGLKREEIAPFSVWLIALILALYGISQGIR